MNVRIIDIAKAAGVSRSAASKALRDAPDISKERIAEIKTIAKQMGYRPNRAASLAKARQSRSIGVLCHNPLFPSRMEWLMSALQEIEDCRYQALTEFSPIDDLALSIERAQGLLDLRVDGLIINPVVDCVGEVEKLRQRCKYILGCTPKNHFPVPVVSPDLIQAGMLAVEHLYDLGHRDWVFVTGGSPQTDMFDKFAGILEASAARAVRFGLQNVIRCKDEIESSREAFAEYLCKNPVPSAVIAQTHLIFRGILKACFRKGLKVPQDVSIVDGHADDFCCDYCDFRPTWIDLKPREIGRGAARNLLTWLRKAAQGQKDYVPEDIFIAPQLIPGQSTWCPAKLAEAT